MAVRFVGYTCIWLYLVISCSILKRAPIKNTGHGTGPPSDAREWGVGAVAIREDRIR